MRKAGISIGLLSAFFLPFFALAQSNTSKVKLQWPLTATANRYVLQLARDSKLEKVFYEAETSDNAFETPDLGPGVYFYQIQGFQNERALTKNPIERFVVGQPITLISKKKPSFDPAAPPTILSPKHEESFPAHGKVRMAWQAVEGARGYRFRLWEEDKVRKNFRRKKQQTPPRWITETKDPWIEIKDAPYMSYMYLDSGLYRWDVAAIDAKNGLVGEAASGYFKVTRDWFLRKNELIFRGSYGLGLSQSFSQTIGTNNSKYDATETAHKLNLETEWWIWRQWGVGLDLGYHLFPASVMLPTYQIHLDAMYRKYFSTVPWGWTFGFSLGLGIQEYAIVAANAAGSLVTEKPKGAGAHFGLRISKKFVAPFELQFVGNALFQAFALSTPTPNSHAAGTFNTDLSARVLYHLSQRFGLGLALGTERRSLEFSPENALYASNSTLSGLYSSLFVQLRSFDDSADKSNSSQWSRW